MDFLKNYVVFDFETSGLDPENDRPIELAALKFSDGLVTKFESFLDWGIEIRPEISSLTGITKELIDSSSVNNPLSVLMAFHCFIGDLPVVGHNIINFDMKFLINSANLLNPYLNCHVVPDHGLYVTDINKNKIIDTAAMFKAKQMGLDVPVDFNAQVKVLETRVPGLKFNVGFACDTLGIDKTKVVQHRAMGDVILTNEIYKKLTN